MTATAFARPALNRRHAMQSIAALAAVTVAAGASVAAAQPESCAGLDSLIEIYEAKEQAHIDLLDLEELLVEGGAFRASRTDHGNILDAISRACTASDDAWHDVLAYAPTNPAEAFAKSRWVMACKFEQVGHENEWRHCEVEALLASAFTIETDLDRAIASFGAAEIAFRAAPHEPSRQDEVAHAAVEAFEAVCRVVAMPVAKPAGLRIKAKALRHIFTAVPDSRPTGTEQRQLCDQILDFLIAHDGDPIEGSSE